MSFDVILIVAFYVACELIANITAGKPVTLPGGVTVPAAVFIYALTFTLIDLINDRLGKQGARSVVYAAFLTNLLLASYIQFAIRLPNSFSARSNRHVLDNGTAVETAWLQRVKITRCKVGLRRLQST